MMAKEPMECKKIIFTGRVQGVGFRRSVEILAKELGVAGYVRNLESGQVELVVETTPHATAELLRRIEKEYIGYIKNVQQTSVPSQNLQHFGIRY